MDERYINMAAAIVKQAMSDYKSALRKDESEKRTKKINECEKFFLSAWGQFLSMGHGEYIMEQCREEVAMERSDLNGREKNVCKNNH